MPNPLHRTTASSRARAVNKRIENQRARLFAELTMLRNMRGQSAQAAATAQRLLTQRWAKANWHMREQLLKSADWLIRLEQNREVQPRV